MDPEVLKECIGSRCSQRVTSVMAREMNGIERMDLGEGVVLTTELGLIHGLASSNS